LSEAGVSAGELDAPAESLRKDGKTVVYAAVDGEPAGIFGIADPIRETTPAAVRALREEGLRLVVLTGDRRTTAEAVARKLGIDDPDDVIADVLPEMKAQVV